MAPPPRLRSNIRAQWIIYALAQSILATLISFHLYRDHTNIGNWEQERLMAQAKVIDENLGFQLKSTSLALDGILQNVAIWQHQKGKTETINRLKVLADAMPGVRTLLILNAKGIVSASNRPELIGTDLSYRDYFKETRQERNLDLIHITPPFKTRLGVFSLNMIKAIKNKDGQFAGLVSATLDPEYFKKLMQSVLYASDLNTSIAHGDGLLMLMVPERPGMAGTNLARPETFFVKHRASGKQATTYSGNAYLTGSKRMVVWRTVSAEGLNLGKPLLVAASRDIHALYEGWRQDIVVHAITFSSFAAITAMFLVLYQRRQQALEAQAEDHAVAMARVEEQLRAEVKLKKHQRSLEAMALELATVEERERLAISRELHDEMGQTLTALKLDFEWLLHRGPEDCTLRAERVAEIGTTIEHLIAKTRHISAELRPPLLDHLGLTAALEWQASDFERRTGINCHLMLNEDAEPFFQQSASMVLRIVQEALTNVIRHAEATDVAISLCRRPTDLILEIADNGRGITPQESESLTAYGLMGMRERARLCNGELSLHATPGGGTTIRLRIPYKEAGTT